MHAAYQLGLEGPLQSVTNSSNRNLSPFKRLWMLWHAKLGHISFSRVQKMAIAGLLDLQAMKLQPELTGDAPCCASCAFGQQTRIPDGTTITSNRPGAVGALKKEQLERGERIFCNHVESSVGGRLFHTAGREKESDRIKGSCLFFDAATNYIHLEHQVSLGASDTIVAKENFERILSHMGVTVDSYHTDNGTFKSKAFVKEIVTNNQAIRFSGVGAKWQNGAAEGAIRIVVSKARTMMIHAALHWPEADDAALWPMALSYSAWLFNHTPDRESGIVPSN